MKKFWITLGLVVAFFSLSAVSAGAVVNDTVMVGLRFGSSAMFSANLENAVGAGYEFGYFDEDRDFVSLGETEETAISMTAAGTVYVDSSGGYSATAGTKTIGAWHVQLSDGYADFDAAMDAAEDAGGWPAYIAGEYVVRVGSYGSRTEAEDAAEDLDGEAVKSGSTGVLVTRTRSTEILFEFDCQGALDLGVMPQGRNAVTWFRGYRYRGGFAYPRVTGGNLSVINVVELEDYVKGVVPAEMNGSWPLAALEAQAVCARTFACRTTKHLSLYGFDVCNGTDCQVYNGLNGATDLSDEAVDQTAGECLYYDGALIEAVYHSADGGATEDAKNVWGGDVPYLQGKEDPYEALIDIPDYSWSVTYTAEQLTWILQQKNYTIGTVRDVYVSSLTPMGNVAAVTFVDSSGKTLTVTGSAASSVFYSSTYGKSVPSQRFAINGSGSGSGTGTSASYYVNGGSDRLSSLEGVTVITGSGKMTLDTDGLWAVTADGTVALSSGSSRAAASSGSSSGTFTITGTGKGHNVGLSQYGAKAMAENGYSYDEILAFYYTDITLG